MPSISTRTIVYKGLLLADQVGRYYMDLADPRVVSAIALVHQRFSTNTFPSWELAHPYRLIAHNGEINTVKGNFNWIRAREGVMSSAVLPLKAAGRTVGVMFVNYRSPQAFDPEQRSAVESFANLAAIAIHNARLKKNSTQRRTLQAYYSRWCDQRTAEWSEIPPRLYQKQDPALPPHFYAKWSVTNILEGTGKRPPDLGPDLPLSQVIKEVQRRAKIKMRT